MPVTMIARSRSGGLALLLLVVAAGAASKDYESNDSKEDPFVVMFDNKTEPLCPWGGYNLTSHPWAVPRPDLGDWYCNITGKFKDQVDKGREEKVR